MSTDFIGGSESGNTNRYQRIPSEEELERRAQFEKLVIASLERVLRAGSKVKAFFSKDSKGQ